MALRVRQAGCRSWLDPSWAPALAAQLTERLLRRCKGERGLFLTLTYNPKDYQSSRDLYLTQSEQQHVPMFFRRLARELGRSFAGRWLCKLEFQKNGNVHFHVIVLGETRIDQKLLTRLWGHGHVWVERMTAKNIKYTCKYLAKAESYPDWLYAERRRGVKIVRTSPGFWDESEGPKENPSRGEGERQRLSFPIWRPVGNEIEAARELIVVHDEDADEYHHFPCPDFNSFVRLMTGLGCPPTGKSGSWLTFDRGDLDDVSRILKDARPTRAGWKGDVRRAGAAGPGPLYLTDQQDPDFDVPYLGDVGWYDDPPERSDHLSAEAEWLQSVSDRPADAFLNDDWFTPQWLRELVINRRIEDAA